MKKSQKATSILEAMIILLIIIVGILGLYNIFNESQKLSNTTKNRIEAIEIAREGIEAMKNIRDTNWLMFGGDKENCWNTLNYDPGCVGDTTGTIGTYIGNNKRYKIYQNNDYKWELSESSIPIGTFADSDYIGNFRVYKENGYYTQSGSTNETIFTREIKVTNLTNTGMIVKSIVNWADNSKDGAHKVELEDLITNWDKD